MADLDAFGTLSFDEDGEDFDMAPEFESLQASFWSTRAAYVASRISHTTAAERFRALRLRSVTGAEWTIGATSSTWYSRVPGGRWERSAEPPVGVMPDRSSLPTWVSQGIDSVDAQGEESSSSVDPDAASFNPFQRKSQPLLDTRAGNVRPTTDADLGWVYEDWDADLDFSDGVPESIDSSKAIDEAADAEAPVDRRRDTDEGFDLDSLFMRPE